MVIDNNTKILLQNLLQKLLDRKLNKLEKNNKEEIASLSYLYKESKKSFSDLKESSSKVNRKVQFIKNKYEEEKRNKNISKLIDINSNNNNNFDTNIFTNYIKNENIKLSHLAKSEKKKKIKKRFIDCDLKANKTTNVLLEEKMNNIQKSIKELRAKFKSTKNIKKNLLQKNFCTVESTPKKKSKIKNIIHTKHKSTIKSPLNKSKNANNINISIKSPRTERNDIKKYESKNEKEKVIDDNNAIKKEYIIIEDKLGLNNIDLKSKFKENLKISIIEPNDKDESFLVKNISIMNSKIINQNEMDKESNINDKENHEIKSININEENKNNNINDTKTLNENNEIKLNEKSDKIINNNRNIDFLKDDTSINFTLIEHNKSDEYDDKNQTLDLNISNESDKLTLEEKFQSHLDDILKYLNSKDIFNLLLTNKECFKIIINYYISKNEIMIDIFEEEISQIIEENKSLQNIDINNIKIKEFEFNSNSQTAIPFLNSISINNFEKIKNIYLTNNEINIIFDIYFIAVGNQNIINYFDNKEKKWEAIFNYFKEYLTNQSLGIFIEQKFNKKIFEYKTISSLYKYSFNYLNIITPYRFQNINKDIALFVFIIRDILEFLGILTLTKLEPEKEIILINSRLLNNKDVIEKLNEINNKIL